MDGGRRICAVEAVPREGSFLFTVRDDGGEVREAIVLRTDDDPGVAAWLNYCQHFTHIRLDRGGGATMRDGEVVCTNHGAYFEADTGRCTFGPCEGAYLTEVAVAVEDGDVFLADPDYGFVRAGPMERDPIDLSSDSNIEF